jgi:hypothetical protein
MLVPPNDINFVVGDVAVPASKLALTAAALTAVQIVPVPAPAAMLKFSIGSSTRHSRATILNWKIPQSPFPPLAHIV